MTCQSKYILTLVPTTIAVFYVVWVKLALCTFLLQHMIFNIHLCPETDLEKKNKRINELSKIIGNGSDKKT